MTTGVPGQSVTYTITTSNAGSSNVTGAGFNDILPSAITAAAAPPNQTGAAVATRPPAAATSTRFSICPPVLR
ncbi:MAG: DUF11 domain-containing protein [Lewinellaceae bacterium]|nr:DUF11 domain-containing protein [Lewinellaceae bacterium]